METLLIAVTLVSLVFALVMSVVAWRAVQGEKQRAAARVAALTTAADVTLVDTAAAEPAIAPVAAAPWRSPAAGIATRPNPSAEALRPAVVSAAVETSTPAAISVQSGFLA